MANTRKRITDTDYFYDRFKAKGLSLRRAAAILGMDHANLSLVLRGKEGRYASIDLVCDLARLFGVPIEEITRRLGYDVPRESSAKVHVIGTAMTERVEDMTRRAGGTVDRPRGAPDDMAAVRLTAEGPTDGWICYFMPAAGIDPSAVGRLAVVRDAEGAGYVGVLTRERDRKWAVKGLTGGLGVGGLTVKSAAPVEWVKTG